MGSICHNYRKEYWNILKEGKHRANGKTVYNVQVGEWDDYCSEGHLTVLMLKDVYDKIMSGEYQVVSQPYSQPPILVTDKNNRKIDPLSDCPV